MHKQKSIIRSGSGFTLLEVMVAVFVISTIMTLIWMSYSRTVESKRYVEAGNEMYHSMRWAMEKIAYDLSAAYVSKGKNTRSIFLGLSNQDSNGIPQDAMTFTSFSHIRYNPKEKSSDQAEISYFVLQNPETGLYNLYRREDFTLDDDLLTGGEILELVQNIVVFNLRYYDGEEWSDDWDSRNFSEMGDQIVEAVVEQTDTMIEALPVAVEISMSMRDQEEQEVFMTTKVKLVLSTIDLKESDEDEEDDSDSDSSSGSDSGTASSNISGSTSSSSGGSE